MAGRSPGSVRRILVGLDGSDHSRQALAWAIRLARTTQAEILAVFAFQVPIYAYYAGEYVPPVEQMDSWRDEMKSAFERQWCRPLKRSGLRYRTFIEDGRPATVIADLAEQLNADMVVIGRRGRSGVAELVLGSTSNELSHHCKRPVVLISGEGRKEKEG